MSTLFLDLAAVVCEGSGAMVRGILAGNGNLQNVE
jgi:hypothetical protein